MRLSFDSNDASKIAAILLRQGHNAEHKFVVTEEGGEMNAILFSGVGHYGMYCHQTSDTAGSHFLGAGIGKGADVKWGSDTCEKAFGRSSPHNSQEANELLDALREQIVLLMSDATRSPSTVEAETNQRL